MRQRSTNALLLLALGVGLGGPLLVAAVDAAPPAPPEVRDHRRGESADPAARSRPTVRDHRTTTGREYRPPVKVEQGTWVFSARLTRPATDAPPEPVRLSERGPILEAGGLPLRTIRDSYWSGDRANHYYYLPKAFHLARDPAGGYGVSAIWTSDQKVLLTLTLRADVDPADVEYALELVRRKEGRAARLLPLPYNGLQLVDLEVLRGWEIDQEIVVPSFGSLSASIPLAIRMGPDSFANLKPLLETEGLGAGVIVTSGHGDDAQANHVDVKISLRYPGGRAYSPVQDVSVGYDRRADELVLDKVRNYLEFPITIDGVDVELRDPEWPRPDLYSGLRVDPPIVLEPGQTASVSARLRPSPLLRPKLGLGGAREDRGSGRDELIRELLEGLLDLKERPETERSEPRRRRRLVALDGLVQRYRLRYTPDFSCQECFDRIWGDLEVVSYVERLRSLRVEILSAAFGDSYEGRQLDTVKVDLRSAFFSPDPDGRRLLNSVSLTSDHQADESLGIYLPRSASEPLTFEYRLTAFMTDGTKLARSGRWDTVEDSLQVLISAADIRHLAGPPGGAE